MTLKLTTSAAAPTAASATATGAHGAEGPIPPPLLIDRRGASIGRAAQNDIVLPDSRNWISSRHCTIAFQGNAYLLTDTSTNGTIVNDRRITAPHVLAHGDTLTIGGYRLLAQVAGVAATPAPPAGSSDPVTRLLQAAGLRRDAVPLPDAAVLAAAGALLRQLAAGTAALAQQRAKARQELGLPAVVDPGNPLLSGAAPDAVLTQLLAAAPDAAAAQTAAALRRIDAHQRAALHAMQGALRATLDQLAPAAIGKTAKDPATAWRAYEAAFAGSGGDSGFTQVFARELAAAYDRIAAGKP